MNIENPAAWGAKRICQDCSAKYYDLNRNPIACPKCGAAFVEPAKPKRAAASAGSVGARGRAGAASSDHGSPWAHRSGSHSPFAETRRAANDESEAANDDDREESTKSEEPEAEERENEKDTNA